MTEQSKDTIYIDVDDEITGIIDKVRGSSHKLVALVLPKRAAVLQSVVNMKLLKRAADDDKKNVVLITSEAGLLPLAGAVGLYVAKTLQTKPALPTAPEQFTDTDSIDEPVDVESEPTDFDPKEVSEKPVGELAGLPKESEQPKSSSPLVPDETIDLNEDELAAAGTIAEAKAENKKSKKGKDKKLKVPDFIRFRRWLILGVVALILLIVGFVLLAKILPKASISIQTNNSNINSTLTLNLSSSTKQLDPSSLTVPAVLQQVTKTNSQQVPTTGQQNNGTQATGTVAMTACESTPSFPPDIPAGTGISVNGLTFVTQQDTSFSHNGTSNGSCFSYPAKNATSVTAQSAGSQYNVGPSTFTVAGRNDVTATSSTTFSGGTNNIINVVAQADIDKATGELAAQDTSSIKAGLQTALQQEGLEPITSSFSTGTPSVTSAPSVGTQANTVTSTQTVTYTMFGVKQSDLTTLIEDNVNKQINTSQQKILSNGVSSATFSVLNQSNGQAQVSMQATSTVGSELNIAAIKKQIVGKKSGDVQSIIEQYPGVQSVQVKFSPFWVSSVPSNTSKTKITTLDKSGS